MGYSNYVKIRDLKPFLKHGGPMTPTGVILHATAGSSSSGAIETLRERGLSYHYIIEKDGDVIKCTPSSKQAWHAGTSVGWAGPYCNRYTVGVSFVNEDDGNEHPITDAQYEAAKELLMTLKDAYPSIKYVSTHYGVSYPRKVDPTQCNAKGIAKAAGLEYWPGRRNW